MNALRFAVDTRPFCLWVHDPIEQNREFLRGVDPAYFEYVARVHAEQLESEQKQAASLSLRIAYSHALESLFAFIGAMLQAPDCIYAWLAQYSNRELFSLIRKIDCREPVLSRLRPEPVSWDTVSRFVHAALYLDDPVKVEKIHSGYARLWGRMAGDFLDETARLEYNSIKHGFRAAAGGISMAAGREDVPGVPCPPEKMRSLGGSEYGSSFFVLNPLPKSSTNFHSRRLSRNWSPVNLINGLHLVSMSMKNLVGRLLVHTGEVPERVLIFHPSDLDAFDYPWRETPGLLEASIEIKIDESSLSLIGNDEILKVYRNESLAAGG